MDVKEIEPLTRRYKEAIKALNDVSQDKALEEIAALRGRLAVAEREERRSFGGDVAVGLKISSETGVLRSRIVAAEAALRGHNAIKAAAKAEVNAALVALRGHVSAYFGEDVLAPALKEFEKHLNAAWGVLDDLRDARRKLSERFGQGPGPSLDDRLWEGVNEVWTIRGKRRNR